MRKIIVDNKEIVLFNGHSMFEINCGSGEIKPAEIAYDNIIKIRENCLYVPCLNIKSAKKKFIKFVLEQAVPQKLSSK